MMELRLKKLIKRIDIKRFNMRKNLSKLRVSSVSYLIFVTLSAYALAEPVNPVTPMVQEQEHQKKTAQFIAAVQPLLQNVGNLELTSEQLIELQSLYQSISPKSTPLQLTHKALLQRVYQLTERKRETLSAMVLDMDLWTQARDQFKWLVDVSEAWPAPYFSLSKLYQLQGDLKLAEDYQSKGVTRYLKQSTEIDMAYVHTQHLVQILLKQAQKEQAMIHLKAFEDYLKNLNPEDPNLPKIALHQELFLLKVHQDMLRLYIDQPDARPQEPKALYDKHPNDPLMAYLYALYLKNKSPKIAQELLQKVLASSPPDSKLYLQAQNLLGVLK